MVNPNRDHGHAWGRRAMVALLAILAAPGAVAQQTVTDMAQLERPSWTDTLKVAPWYFVPVGFDIATTAYGLDRCGSCVELTYGSVGRQAAVQFTFAAALSFVDAQGIGRIRWRPLRLVLRWGSRLAVLIYFGRAGVYNLRNVPAS